VTEPEPDEEFTDELDDELCSELDAEFSGDLEEELTDDQDEDEEESRKATVQPARPWPQFNRSRAHAELLALEMLTRGASYLRVRHITKLSPKNVRRLQALVAEEGANPAVPRIVCKGPARGQRAGRPGGPARDAPPPKTPDEGQDAEPVQMTFFVGC
jgi:hypothetical protein